MRATPHRETSLRRRTSRFAPAPRPRPVSRRRWGRSPPAAAPTALPATASAFLREPVRIGADFSATRRTVIAATVAIARMVGLMTVMPIFLRLGMTGLLRGTVGLVLALPAMPMIAAAMRGSHPSLALWGGLVIKEVVVGLLVGMVLGVPIWSAQFAGDVIDAQQNATGQLPDPSSVDAAVTGTVMSLTIMALYFVSCCSRIFRLGYWRGAPRRRSFTRSRPWSKTCCSPSWCCSISRS
jgi:hypothetical protein